MVEWVRASTGDRTVDDSSPTSVKKILFGTLAIPFTPLCQCLSDETVKAGGPFYRVSMPGGSKISHQSALECVTVVDSTSLSKPPRSASMWLKKLPCTDKGRRNISSLTLIGKMRRGLYDIFSAFLVSTFSAFWCWHLVSREFSRFEERVCFHLHKLPGG